MAEQEITKQSVFDVFASQQETFEEAQRKSSDENRKRANYLRFSADGTYSVRVLPLAPVINADGEPLPMDRKGYEYPLRSLILKIEDDSKLDNKGNPKIQHVAVCNAKQAFKELQEDLIDAYVRIAGEKYADDKTLIDKLHKGSFEGGLKWDSHRCMYVYENSKRNEGIQLFQLSFPQYREVEERKLNVWGKLTKRNPKAGCPLSSIADAYPLEVTRKTENKKVSYSFNIDTVSGTDTLTEDELQALLDMPRLPEVIYRYRRYHLEATIVYLQQLDNKFGIRVMDTAEIAEVIETIKMLLPADDSGHFTLGGSKSEDRGGATDTLDDLWNRWDDIDSQGLDDKSDEGAELRADLKEFIEDNELDVKIARGKTNQQILEEIEQAIGGHDDEEKAEEEAAEAPADDQPAAEPAEEAKEEDFQAYRNRRAREEHNDDTAEPAARAERRSGRPERRRR